MSYAALGNEAQLRFGWNLFTAMRCLPSGEVERVHTSDPAAYPLGGRKPRRDTAWSRQVLERGEPYYANDEAGLRAAFEDAMQHYIDFYLAHMALEERELLPLAERVLTKDDWEELDAAFRRNRDPLTGHAPEADYEALFSRITRQVPAPWGLG